jgi:ABC-type sugar transport system ATPase subunit
VETEQARQPEGENGGPVLEIRDLTKRFGATLALSNVSLTLGRNEVLALLGDNGAGKSTLIKCLSGVHEPDEGQILIDGKEVHRAVVLRQGNVVGEAEPNQENHERLVSMIVGGADEPAAEAPAGEDTERDA